MQSSTWDFANQEQRDGVRFSWGIWPTTVREAKKLVVPLGCLYTPMKSIENMPGALAYDPLRCACGAVLNPHVQVDFRSKMWTCCFCAQRNHFPQHYADNISEQSLPAELISNFTTVEYELQNQPASGPVVFLFVVDTCCDEAELSAMKDSLSQAVNSMPPDALIGFIAFGTLVHVYEVGFQECSKSYAFRGDKEHSVSKIQEMLNIIPTRNGAPIGSNFAPGRSSGLGRFLTPVQDAQFSFEQILKDLQKDPWPCNPDERVQRCTGSAISVAMGLLESCVPRQGSRLMLLISGPPTVGPGYIVSRKKADNIRSHLDIQKGRAKELKPAYEYYHSLSERAIATLAVVDIFACSLDQTGLLELAPLVKRTGGQFVLADKFGQSVFQESLRRVFEQRDGHSPGLAMGFGAQIELITSREFKVAGGIGPCASLKKASANVSENQLGVGGTSAWFLGGIDPGTTMSFFFDINPQNDKQLDSATRTFPSHKRRHIQFLTTYQTPSGRMRLRVTTTCGLWHGTTETGQDNTAALVRSFDQDAAAVLITRQAILRSETDHLEDVIRYLDNSLIKLCQTFASYQKEKPESFRLNPEFLYYPSYMFYLRRSKFLQPTNNSPDEQTVYKHIFNRETTANSVIMLQPTLLSYSFNGPPQPVLLDAASVKPDTILLLDTFFHVVICHGETIAIWKQQGYQNHEEHVNFRNLLAAPQNDAQAIMSNRFPLPRYIVSDQNKSDARFLMSHLNPSVTHHNDSAAGGQAKIFTDDVSLRVFMESLIKQTVSPSY